MQMFCGFSHKGLTISWFLKYGTGIRYLKNHVVKPVFLSSFESLTLIKMDCLTITQRIKIIKIYYKNAGSATVTYHRQHCRTKNKINSKRIGKCSCFVIFHIKGESFRGFKTMGLQLELDCKIKL